MIWVVAAALFDGTGNILLQTRPEGKAMAGLWEFPGGKVDFGETPEAALIRELKEELAIDAAVGSFTPVGFAGDEDLAIAILLYRCQVWTGLPVPQDGQVLKWVSLAAVMEKAMPPLDTDLAKFLLPGRGHPF